MFFQTGVVKVSDCFRLSKWEREIVKVIAIDEEESEVRDLTLATRRFEPETVCREYRARRRAVAGDRKIMMEQWWWCYYSII